MPNACLALDTGAEGGLPPNRRPRPRAGTCPSPLLRTQAQRRDQVAPTQAGARTGEAPCPTIVPPPGHSCDPTVIPAQAGIHPGRRNFGHRASVPDHFPPRREQQRPNRTSSRAGNRFDVQRHPDIPRSQNTAQQFDYLPTSTITQPNRELATIRLSVRYSGIESNPHADPRPANRPAPPVRAAIERIRTKPNAPERRRPRDPPRTTLNMPEET